MSDVLAEAGVNLVLAARKKDRCEAACIELEKKYNIQAEPVGCNVTSPEDCNNLIETAIKRFGKIDILINNSGATWGADVLEHSLENWNKVIDTNLTAIFALTQLAARKMKDQGGGKIINIASTAGLRNPKNQSTPAYNASKAAVIHMTRDMALQLGKYNIYVNAIAPGYFPSHMTAGTLDKVKGIVEANNPLGRIGNENDLKGAILYYSSPASDYVTGNILVIDGGSSI